VNSPLNSGILRASERLKKIRSDEVYEVRAVSDEVYEDLWRRDVPILWHWDENGARMVAYDLTLGKTFIVSCYRSTPSEDCGTWP